MNALSFAQCRRPSAFAAAAIALALAAVAMAQEARYFRIGTGSTDDTYFAVGAAIASVISSPRGSRECGEGRGCGVPGLIAMAISTGGAAENVGAVASGAIDSAITQADIAYWAFSGTGAFQGRKPMDKLRAVGGLYTDIIHLAVRRDSNIGSVRDLRGKRVSLGESGSGTAIAARLILGAFGLAESDVRAQSLKIGTAADLLREGRLDALFLVAGLPDDTLAELAENVELKLLPLAGEEVTRLRRGHEFFRPGIIPRGTYRGADETASLGVPAIWIVSADVPDSIAYGITKALWSQAARQRLETGMAEGRIIRLQDALAGVSLPLHPGAAQFYREAGIVIR